MIRVISTPKAQVECHACSTLFEYDFRDMEFSTNYNLGERYVVCPICGNRIYVERNIPSKRKEESDE